MTKTWTIIWFNTNLNKLQNAELDTLEGAENLFKHIQDATEGQAHVILVEGRVLMV